MRPLGWFLRVLLAAAAGPDTRAAVLSDLDEEFANRMTASGERSARRWLVSQTARSLWPLTARRLDPLMPHRPLSSSFRQFRPQLTHACRALRRAPGFTLVAVVTLALGIGVSTATFSALSAALLQPLPYPTHTRLAVISETRGSSEISVAYPDLQDWQTQSASFEALAGFRGVTATLTGTGDAERIRAQEITSNLFRVLSVQPAIGRAFTSDDDRAGAPRTVLLSDHLWRRRFGADARVVGSTIALDAESYLVAGVMPPDFQFPDGIVFTAAPDVYLSIGPVLDGDLTSRGSHSSLEAIGLLAPGVSIDRARDDITRLQARIAGLYPETTRGVGVHVADPIAVIVGDLGSQLTTVWGASLLLLLIACANVAGLTLTRSVSRQRELSVRTALGGSRASLAFTLVLEQLIVSSLGALAGVALAFGLTAAVRHEVTDLPRLAGLEPDLRALATAVGLTVVTALICSVAPIAWLSRASLDPWLRERGQTRSGWRLRRLLVGGQLALALTLAACAGLLGTSLARLEMRHGGIVPGGVLTFDLALPDRVYPRASQPAFYADLYTRLAALPGVHAIGGISTLPFSGGGTQSGIQPRGGTTADAVRCDVATVTPDYFAAMGVGLVHGRLFDARDAGSPRTTTGAVVDERFAERFWPNQSALGQHISGWGFDDLEVIGVVAHVDNYGVGHDSREELYLPFAARPGARLTTVIRSTADLSALAPLVREAVASIDASLAVSKIQTMDIVVGRTIAGERLAARVSGSFGLLAVVLAGIGIYGLVAYAVEMRRREAGLRLALGAAPHAIVRMMAMSMTTTLVGGAVIGLLGASIAGAVVRHQLFDVGPYDPVVLLASTAALTVVAILATWLPARRLARVSPATALQLE